MSVHMTSYMPCHCRPYWLKLYLAYHQSPWAGSADVEVTLCISPVCDSLACFLQRAFWTGTFPLLFFLPKALLVVQLHFLLFCAELRWLPAVEYFSCLAVGLDLLYRLFLWPEVSYLFMSKTKSGTEMYIFQNITFGNIDDVLKTCLQIFIIWS